MTTIEILQELESYGDEKRLKSYKKQSEAYSGNGALLGNLRKLAKKIKVNHQIAIELWDTENTDAQVLATMIFDYDKFSKDEVVKIVESIKFPPLIGEFVPNIANKDYADDLIDGWINSEENVLGKAGFMIIVKKVLTETIDINKVDEYLSIIQREMKTAPKDKQETMNRALVEIGIHHSKYTKKCMDIGEELEVYKDMKVAKGCYSPYAPNWISLMLERNSGK